jgi:hypothetical protein
LEQTRDIDRAQLVEALVRGQQEIQRLEMTISREHEA